MKGEIINSIAKEINQQSRVFQEQVVMKELNKNEYLLFLYPRYKEKIFPQKTKKDFAAIYSQTVIFILLSAALFNSNMVRVKDLNKILVDIIRRLKGMSGDFQDILMSIATIDIPGPCRKTKCVYKVTNQCQ